MRSRNSTDDRRRRGGRRTAEGESHTYGRPSDLGWEQFGVVAQASAEASRDKEIQEQSHPEQARETVEISQYYQEDRSREYKAGNDVTSAKQVGEPAAKVIGEDGAEHPDRKIARRCLKPEMLFVGEKLRHPSRPTNPGEKIEEGRGKHLARVLPHRRPDVESLLQPFRQHCRSDVLKTWALLDAQPHPENQQSRQDSEPVERPPSPQRHDDESRQGAQHVTERVPTNEAAERRGTPFRRRGLADHDHADRSLALERNACDRSEDQQLEWALREAGETGEQRITEDRQNEDGPAAVQISECRKGEDSDQTHPARYCRNIPDCRRRDAPLLDEQRRHQLHYSRLINVESEAEHTDRPHRDAVCGPPICCYLWTGCFGRQQMSHRMPPPSKRLVRRSASRSPADISAGT